MEAHPFPVDTASGEDYNFPDKWVSFILNLPAVFAHHRSQWIVEKVDALWDCVLHRLTLGGAASFSAWWMTKVFFHEMMVWQAEKGGFMRSTANSLQSVTFGAEQPGLGSFNLKQNVEGIGHAQAKSNSTPSVDINQAHRRAGEGEPDVKHASDEKELALAEAGFQSPNNDDSAIDLGDDPMMIVVGKYGDMMASDPADAEGDVVVI